MRISYALAGMVTITNAFKSEDLVKSVFAKGGHFRAFTFDGSESSAKPVFFGDFRSANRGASDLKLDAIVHSYEPSADGELVSWSLVDDQLSFVMKKRDSKGGEEVLADGCMELNDAVHGLPPYRLLAGAFDASFAVPSKLMQSHPSMEVSDMCDPSMVRFFEWTGDKYIACQGYTNKGEGSALLASPQCDGQPCDNTSFCRSKWGWCGEGTSYCNDVSTWMPSCAENIPPQLNQATHIFGKDFHIELTPSTVNLKLAPLNAAQHAKCPSLYGEAAHVYPVATPQNFVFSEKDWPWQENEDDATARRLASGKECIFFHGTGQSDERAPTSTYTDYWGNVHKDTNQCSSRRFAHFDTKNFGWTDTELQRKHCEVLLGGTGFEGWDTTGRVAENKIIFSHSMGNLILGGAISNNLCQLGNSSSWYESQGPLAGSKATNMAQDICTGWWDWVTLLVEWAGFCVPAPAGSSNTRETSIAYKSMKMEVDFTKAQVAIKENVKGAMCGDTAWGLNSIYSPALQALAAFVWFDGDNDGMVEVSSCRNPIGYDAFNGWGSSYSNNFYHASINHQDGTCYTADGWWGSDRKPCSWFGRRN